MENIYKLEGRMAEIECQYNELSDQLEEMYIANEGEVTEQTEAIEAKMAELEALRDQVVKDIIDNSDAYAECALNAIGKQKVAEAELKAWQDQTKNAEAVYKSRITHYQKKAEWWKENLQRALNNAEVKKLGGAKTGLKHTIWLQETKGVEVDEAVIMEPWQQKIDELRRELPEWMSIDVCINKTALGNMAALPDGAARTVSESLRLR